MKHNKILSYVILGSFVLLTAACVEEVTTNEDKYRPVGTPIVFSASTGYDNGIETRAEYSGELFGTSPKYERIDWKKDDPIRIVYNGSASDYTVKANISYENEISFAELSGSDLTWDGSGNHVFYALYPSGGSASGGLTTAGVVTGELPNQQDVDPNNTIEVGGITKYQPNTKKFGYMAAHETITEVSDAYSVDLHFRPAVTTFEFKFRRPTGSTDKKVASFVMSVEEVNGVTTPLCGQFSLKIDGHNDRGATWSQAPTVTNGGDFIKVGFPTGGVSIPETGYLDFSLIALPIDLTGIKLTLNYVDNTSKSVLLKDNMTGPGVGGTWHTFIGAKKYVLTTIAPGDSEWVYTLTEVDPTTDLPIPVTDIEVTGPAQISGTKPFKSYKTNTQTNEQALVNVKFQYAPVLSNGTPGEWSNTLPTWLSQYVVTHKPDPDVPGDPQETPTTSWMSQMDFTVMNHDGGVIIFNEIDDHTRILRNNMTHPANGFTSSSPQDLSLYEINSLTSPRANGKPKTANCYVVDRRGWYMFPLVYGNAIDWDWAPENGWNTSSWRDNDAGITGWSDATAGYKLRHFQNYVDDPISSPYILNDIGFDPSTQNLDDLYEAVIVWEDVETPFISTSSVQIISPYTESTTKYVAENGSTKVVVPYIKFQVNESIMQGNALIALREKTGDKRIIWSWHIWITDLDMNTQNVPTHAGSVVSSNDMLQYHIGWCDTRIGRKYSYEPRVYYVKISHTEAESDADPLIFKVTETAPPFTSITVSCGTTYEAGRKDPFLPGMSEEHFWVEGQGPTANWTYINKPVYSPTYGTITVGNNRVLTGVVTSEMDDMSHTIQHPYILYTGGYIGWLNNHRPRNLWNMRDTDDWVHNQYLPWHQHGTLELDYSPQYQYDVLIWKTVYDPCPPGFSVPNYTFATGFTTTGYNIEWQGSGGRWYVSDAVWIPEDAEVYPDVVIDGDVYGDFRTYLSTNSGTMCFPGSGYRGGDNGAIGGISASFYLMSGKFKGDRYVVSFNNVGPVGAGTSRVNCYAIRPVREQPRPTGLGSRIGGQDVLVNDYSGNSWQ